MRIVNKELVNNNENNEQQEFVDKSELREKINNVAYSFLWKINNIKKQQQQLESKLNTTEEQLDKFLYWLSDQIDTGWKQGLDMSELSKEYCKLLQKHKNICFLNFLE